MFVSRTHLVHGRNEIQKETNDQLFYFFTFLEEISATYLDQQCLCRKFLALYLDLQCLCRKFPALYLDLQCLCRKFPALYLDLQCLCRKFLALFLDLHHIFSTNCQNFLTNHSYCSKFHTYSVGNMFPTCVGNMFLHFFVCLPFSTTSV